MARRFGELAGMHCVPCVTTSAPQVCLTQRLKVTCKNLIDFLVGLLQEEVQLREQDFGNFQDPQKIKADLAERNRFGRFYYRWVVGMGLNTGCSILQC